MCLPRDSLATCSIPVISPDPTMNLPRTTHETPVRLTGTGRKQNWAAGECAGGRAEIVGEAATGFYATSQGCKADMFPHTQNSGCRSEETHWQLWCSTQRRNQLFFPLDIAVGFLVPLYCWHHQTIVMGCKPSPCRMYIPVSSFRRFPPLQPYPFGS